MGYIYNSTHRRGVQQYNEHSWRTANAQVLIVIPCGVGGGTQCKEKSRSLCCTRETSIPVLEFMMFPSFSGMTNQ